MQVSHILIVGQTMAGKTTLAKMLTRATRVNRPDSAPIIYDPNAVSSGLDIGGWGGFVFTGWERFAAAFWSNTGRLVIIDEAPTVFARHKYDAQEMLMRGRHVIPDRGGGGHVVALLAQRHKGLDKTARDQCSNLFAFNQSIDDADDLARDWVCPFLRQVTALPPMQYIHLARHCQPVKGQLENVFSTQAVPV